MGAKETVDLPTTHDSWGVLYFNISLFVKPFPCFPHYSCFMPLSRITPYLFFISVLRFSLNPQIRLSRFSFVRLSPHPIRLAPLGLFHFSSTQFRLNALSSYSSPNPNPRPNPNPNHPNTNPTPYLTLTCNLTPTPFRGLKCIFRCWPRDCTLLSDVL